MKQYLLDIGNTSTRIAIYKNRTISDITVFPTQNLETEISPFLLEKESLFFVSSVVPTKKIFLQNSIDSDRLIFICPATLPEFDLSLIDGNAMGSDRLANMAAACYWNLLPAVIIDCGTAINCEIITKAKQCLGGIIMPGRQLLRQALNHYTALLPLVPLNDLMPEDSWGTTTNTAISVGTNLEAVGGVKFLAQSLAEQFPNFTIQLTGGDADFFSQHTGLPIAPPMFTLYGLAYLADKYNTHH